MNVRMIFAKPGHLRHTTCEVDEATAKAWIAEGVCEPAIPAPAAAAPAEPPPPAASAPAASAEKGNDEPGGRRGDRRR